MHTAQPACRSCGARGLESVLALGELPLASRLLTADELDSAEPSYPLELVFCPTCSLVQLKQSVPHEELFGDYIHFSSTSPSKVRHARDLAARVIAVQRLRPSSLVVDIGSNDGYLLANYQQADIPVLGIEPAVNLAKYARVAQKIPTWCRYFSRSLAEELAGCDERADVIHAHNVLAHVADLNGFLSGIHALLKDTGVAIVEVPYVKDLIDNVEFDTIYHEHVCYFSLTSLSPLVARAGLVIHDVERISAHGGSLRLYLGREGKTSDRARKLLKDEARSGIDRADYYRDFADRVNRLRQQLVSFLTELKSQGRRIAVYGASAKGSTLLNYFQIGRETVDFAVDRNAAKQGRYTPGSHLEVYSPDKLVEERPDYVLLLSWDFAEEVLAQQSLYRQHGGRFIIPIPELKVA